MIRVSVSRRNHTISKVEVSGHAGYADYGKDIVCASVSTCVITTVNGIFDIAPDYLKVEETSSRITMMIQRKDELGEKLLNNMLDLLSELRRQYPKNITIIDKEENS